MKRFLEKGDVFFPKVCLTMNINESHLFLYSLCCSITHLIASRRQPFSLVRVKKKRNTT